MMPTKKHFYFLAIVLLSFSTIVSAENEEAVWYSVEYIVFENNPLSSQSLEPWKKEPLMLPKATISLDGRSNTKAFSSLSTGQQQLHGVYKRLRRLSSYTPIAHGGWLQPLKEKEKLNPVQITHQADTIQLEGTLTFHRRRFLHLDVDLQLSEMIPLARNDNYLSNNDIQPATVYRLKETRRIKTNNTYYFDHPRFGVLAIVKKVDSPKKPISRPKAIEQDESLENLELKKSAQATHPN